VNAFAKPTPSTKLEGGWTNRVAMTAQVATLDDWLILEIRSLLLQRRL
jgi:hypothetical protein